MFALYVAGYSGFRIFEETLRIDYSEHVLGLRLNFFVALVLCLLGLFWFVGIQRGWRGFGGRGADEAEVAALRRAVRGRRGSAAQAAATTAAQAQPRAQPLARRAGGAGGKNEEFGGVGKGRGVWGGAA